MNHIRWTSLSLEDLQGISAYIEAQRNLVTINRVCRAIYDAVQKLRRFPEAGKLGLGDGTRELVVPEFPAYIVVYRLASQQAVEVLRIWHGAQQRTD